MANPEDSPSRQSGARIPRGRAAGPLTIAIDAREKYGWKFSSRPVAIERRALPAGDYAAVVGGTVAAVIERKTLENLASSLSDGGLAFQMQRLAEVARAAIVVEGDYPDLFRTQPGRGSWLATCWDASLSDTPRFRSSSRVRGGSRRSGRSASLEQQSPTALLRIRHATSEAGGTVAA